MLRCHRLRNATGFLRVLVQPIENFLLLAAFLISPQLDHLEKVDSWQIALLYSRMRFFLTGQHSSPNLRAKRFSLKPPKHSEKCRRKWVSNFQNHKHMTPAAPIARQQGFLENPFEVPSFRSRSRPMYSGETIDYSQFSRLKIRPPFVTAGFDPSSSFYWQPLRPEGNPLSPALMFANLLHSLFVSKELRLSRKLGQRLMELSALKSGWNGENAFAPKPEAMAHTVGLILYLQTALPEFEEPFVVPTISGFTQLEWQRGQRALEFEATADGWSVIACETKSRGERVYHEADITRFDVDKLLTAYRWFAGQELLWPII